MVNRVRLLLSFVVIIALFVVVSPILSHAHVTVNPSESAPNAYEKYGVRIPVEKDVNTVEVTLRVPDGINLLSVQPVVDWDYELDTNDSGEIKAVTWKANSGGIGPNEFTEFHFIAVNPEEPGEFSWEAIQTYEDGSVVEWIDPPGSAEPASVTEVTAGTSEVSGTETSSSSPLSSPWLPIGLAGVAVLLSLIGLFRK